LLFDTGVSTGEVAGRTGGVVRACCQVHVVPFNK
jgi:hypothetical protein